MNKKTSAVLFAGLFALAATGVVGVLSHQNAGLVNFTKANTYATGSYTLTAADFNNGSGDISISGVRWHYDNAAVSGSKVTISGVMFTTVASGADANNGRRGDGYTRMVFEGLDTTGSSVVYHTQDAKNTTVHAANALAADVDLTNGGAWDSASRRGIYFAQPNESSFSFTSLTMHYGCTDVTPTVTIDTSLTSIGVGENVNISASNSDVYPSDVVSYSWESNDTDVLTVVGDGAKATVTGVAAGDATITVTMTVNGEDYTDTLNIEVSEASSTIVNVAVLDTSFVQGAGVFCRFNPSSVGLTAADFDSFSSSISVLFPASVENSPSGTNMQEKSDTSYTAYVTFPSAVGLNGAFEIDIDFRDTVNSIIYSVVWHFDNGSLASEINLSAASFSVEAGSTLEVTASKASYVKEGETTYSFTSSNTDIFTVTSTGNVATITGVGEGSATLTVTMTVADVGTYTTTKTISVTEPGVEHLISWYTDGSGNQTNHWDGAGVWCWVNYGEMGYSGFAEFSNEKNNMTASYESDPATTIRIDVVSDDIPAATSCRVYLVAGAAFNTGILTMTIPDADGVTCTGTITFVDGVATAYNA